MKRLITLGALMLLMAISATPVAAESVEEITKELMCQCGCNMVLYNCDCSNAGKEREFIRTKLDEGQTRQQIIAYYVEQYGETVLSAPTKEGFNIAAWTFPFAALSVGIVAVGLVLRRWIGSRGEQEDEESCETISGELDAYEERLRKELQEFER
ncbi:MAG: cytochrome c-type biogenesis protein CcmH [Dehalococcoidales bacterium]|nr:cytochrome c-type biogenesis protein CcmH [Dehalococcoidales bacterium]